MRESLGGHDVEKGSVAILSIKTLGPLPKGIRLDDILGSGSKRSINLDRLILLGPAIHTPHEIRQSVINGGHETSDILLGKELADDGPATTMQGVILGRQDRHVLEEEGQDGVGPLSTNVEVLGVELINEARVVYVDDIRPDADDGTVFAVHLLDGPDVLASGSFEYIVVGAIPAGQCC